MVSVYSPFWIVGLLDLGQFGRGFISNWNLSAETLSSLYFLGYLYIVVIEIPPNSLQFSNSRLILHIVIEKY